MIVRILPQAEEELYQAVLWYEDRESGLGLHLVEAYDAARLIIEERADRLPRLETSRQLRHYRTHTMLNDIEPDNEVWRYCHSLFPAWIGFLPERRQPTPELLAAYRRGDIASRWCLRKLEREMDGDT